MGALTPKQARFIDEYLVDLNQTQAAIRAGYSPRSAKVIAHETITKPDVRGAIDQAIAERSAELKVSQNYVTRTIVDTVERCRGLHLVRDRNGKLVRMETEDGKECVAVQFDAKNVLTGLTLLGRHLGMEKLAVTDPDGRAFGSEILDRLELSRRAAFMLTNPGPAIEGESSPA
jgi:phage terminase small subunit